MKKDKQGAEQALRKALAAFKRAEAGEITPAALAAELRELLGSNPGSSSKLWKELEEFVNLDLSDYAYSLAIHDQPAIDRLNREIKKWAERLSKELSE